MLIIFTIFFTSHVSAQTDDQEEVSVNLTLPDVGTTELATVVRGKSVYLSATGLFSFLKIKSVSSAGLDSVSGFFISADSTFLIDKKRNLISYRKHIFPVGPADIIVTKSSLYLREDYFSEVFGLDCHFNFRTLAVTLTTKKDLPVLKEKKNDLMRANVNQLKGTIKTDTTLRRQAKLLNGGMIDWSVYDIKSQGAANDVRANIGMGAIVAGGETNVLLSYHNQETFKERQQYYLWRYANNENTNFRQVLLGKIISPSISSIFAPVLGAQVTNAPTTYRRAFDGYQYSGYTDPNWLVELYVNGELVNYKKADPSGFYTFNVPLVYGTSIMKLRFYGPFGEERTKQISINIPFNFLPVNEFEYTGSAGVVEDSAHSKFSRLAANYGLNKMMTVGGGVEYLSSIRNGSTMPFLTTSARLAAGLLFNGDFVYGVRSKALLTYRLPSNMQIEGTYTHYVPGQTAINVNYLREAKIAFSVPLQLHAVSLYSRITYDRIDVPYTHYSNSDWLLTIAGRYVSANITTYAMLYAGVQPYIFTNYALTFRLPAGFILTPQVQYEYRLKDIISVRSDLEKKILNHGYLNMTYERNFKTGYVNAMLSFRYEFGFGIFGTNVSRTNGKTTVEQSVSNSIILQKGEPVILNKSINVGKGGVRLVCFLDLNGNGVRDKGEPKVGGLKVKINAAQTIYDVKDTSVVAYQMEPYINYVIQLDQEGFQNIAWSLSVHSLTVYIEPNQVRMIELPILVKAEASGRVVSLVNGALAGQDRMVVDIVNSIDNRVISRSLTEADGSFSYLGLKPGKYKVMLDANQLKKLKLISSPAFIPLNIGVSKDGAFIDSLVLTIRSSELAGLEPGKKASVLKNRKIVAAAALQGDKSLNSDSPDAKAVGKAGTGVVANRHLPGSKVVASLKPALTLPVTAPVPGIAAMPVNVSVPAVASVPVVAAKIAAAAATLATTKPVITPVVPVRVAVGPKSATNEPGLVPQSDNRPEESPYALQTVSFGTYRTAQLAQVKMQKELGKPVKLLMQKDYYKLRVTGIYTREQADIVIKKMKKLGYYALMIENPRD